MDYTYRGTFIISPENTHQLPSGDYEVYHCDKVRSLLDEINLKGKNMYAKVQEIRFPDADDYTITFSFYDGTSPYADGYCDSTWQIAAPPIRYKYVNDYYTYWDEECKKRNKQEAGNGPRWWVRIDNVGYLEVGYGYDSYDKIMWCVEFGLGLQYEFGLPPRIGRFLTADHITTETIPTADVLNKDGSQFTDEEWGWGVKRGDRWRLPKGFPRINAIGQVRPPFCYFSHSDLVGNSLNLQRLTTLVDVPEGNLYDSRDDYIYVHNCSPFPHINFTGFIAKPQKDGSIDYEKYKFTPRYFYVIIDYYEG